MHSKFSEIIQILHICDTTVDEMIMLVHKINFRLL